MITNRQLSTDGGNYTQSTLQLCSVDHKDGGNYTCVAQSSTDSVSTRKSTQLIVLSKPGNMAGMQSSSFLFGLTLNTSYHNIAEVIALSSNETVFLNSTTLLTCVGHGVPTATIRWEKDGTRINNSSMVSLE